MNKRLLPAALAAALISTLAFSASAQTTAPPTDSARANTATSDDRGSRDDSRTTNPRHATERDATGSTTGTTTGAAAQRDGRTDPMDRTPASTDPTNRGTTGAAVPPTGGSVGRTGTEDPTGMHRNTAGADNDFGRWDTDRDDFLSRQELDANRSWTGDNTRLDRDGDGRVSRAEWDEYQRDYGAGNDPVHPSLKNDRDIDGDRDER